MPLWPLPTLTPEKTSHCPGIKACHHVPSLNSFKMGHNGQRAEGESRVRASHCSAELNTNNLELRGDGKAFRGLRN